MQLCNGLFLFASLLLRLTFTLAGNQNHASRCKAIPGSQNWPQDSEWESLSNDLSGRLIKTVPPGAVCHPDQPSFNLFACPAVQAGWLTTAWHAENPVSVSENNWANDTCLPNPMLPCSGQGYPIYVVNATQPSDVKAGVDFARKHNIRLNVKGTGHDYLGRSVAPNSLSIWTHHIRGLDFHKGFKPKGCTFTIDTDAVTAAAGQQMLEIDYQSYLRNLTIISGGAGTVGIGGYLTGGGHSALSSTYGLAADQVLEMEIVTPGGDILTVNECQNRDLFWAMRGGGGSTFGVLTSATFKAYRSSPFITATAFFATAPGSEDYLDVMASILSQYPHLDEQGISTYAYMARNHIEPGLNITNPIDGFFGVFNLPALSPSNSSASLGNAINELFSEATAPYPETFFTYVTTTTCDTYWDFYKDNNGPLDASHDQLVGSRLLSRDNISKNTTAVKEALRKASAGGPVGIYLVGGKGVQNAKPRGGGNAVNSAWRKAYVHSLVGVRWSPFDTADRKLQEELLTGTYTQALRDLAPDMGAYINEAYPYEPDYQHVFWGDNYERLLRIKRRVDPHDVLWCQPCVGNERWELIGDVLCKKLA